MSKWCPSKSIDAQTMQSAYAKEMGLQVLCPDKFMSRCSDLYFEAHTGAIDMCSVQPDLQASGNIVMKLLANIPRHKGHKLFIDN